MVEHRRSHASAPPETSDGRSFLYAMLRQRFHRQ